MNLFKEAQEIQPTKMFDGVSHYTSWAARMRAILLKKKCWGVVGSLTFLPKLLPPIYIPEGSTAQPRANAVAAKTKREAKNEETHEVIDTLVEQRVDAIYYIMMNVREHIIHHISAFTHSHRFYGQERRDDNHDNRISHSASFSL
ncbi:hypothetical protein AXG93_3943s1320 [Marchantia polymorpha subsp. ruderalis]|uniref:DUF4219 domain-containing protein n=1 Tax=Marchantia polymorpha subsp. ruderalis TaxID=1480154 RepID=A0A176WE73_MARPO|nr:hypothetical protein AXG93_3943s1320 [Marchantia polymorpha subsp. ruderalis]